MTKFKIYQLSFLFLISLAGLSSINGQDQDDVYSIGAGIADVTGPVAEVNMMGYAKMSQDASGIHFRLRSRAFIFEDQMTKKRVAYVSIDAGMIDQAITTEVVRKLKEKFNDLYTEQNVLLSGTHTHSGPGGFLQYLLYTITAQGFNHQTFNAMVEGIVRSIERAHHSMKKGRIFYNEGPLLDASINRSPSAYLNNTVEERDLYQNTTDKNMYLLKLVDLDNNPIGSITWFAVHPTSMNNTNKLVSGDNKGWASNLMEKKFNPGKLSGQGPVVCAFGSSNLGDVSPNIKGPHCIDTGLPCDFYNSTCGGKNKGCIAFGPGVDMFDSTRIIAERQYNKAMELFESAKIKITGPIDFAHQYIDMTNQQITRKDGTTVKTCNPAMGYSFAAGTIDGPGEFDFTQGTTTPNKFWNLVRDFLSKPSKEMIECHSPKPILLATGQLNFPYQWQPHIVPTQLFRIGNLYLAGVPGEFTTMSGRRLRHAIRSVVTEQKEAVDAENQTLRSNYIKNVLNGDNNLNSDVFVLLSGLSNCYSSYISTFEEYQIQRYEGASTIFGPHTQAAYSQQFVKLANAIKNGEKLDTSLEPPNLLHKQFSLRPGVVFDLPYKSKHFGAVIEEPEDSYKAGLTVQAVFVAGHPKNDIKLEQNFMEVLKKNETDQTWEVIANDGSLETKFTWEKVSFLLGQSRSILEWMIPEDVEPGVYKMRHYGNHKTVFQSIKSYVGETKEFTVNL